MTHSACVTPADHANRKLALLVGWCATSLFLFITIGGWWHAYQKDLRRTELNKAEDAIIETLQFGRVIVNADGNIVSANEAFKKWTRWSDPEGKALVTVIPDDMRDIHRIAFFKAVDTVIATGKSSKPLLVECKLPRIDDPSKVTHVTIAVSVVSPQNEPERPYVVAYLYKTRALGKVAVSGR